MKRMMIFTALYAPIALVIFNLPDVIQRHDFRLLDFAMLGLAYPITLAPALLSGTVDWKLSAAPIYFRLPVAALTGTVTLMAEIIVFSFGEILASAVSVLMIALIGAVPAAVCSLLSDRLKRSEMV